MHICLNLWYFDLIIYQTELAEKAKNLNFESIIYFAIAVTKKERKKSNKKNNTKCEDLLQLVLYCPAFHPTYTYAATSTLQKKFHLPAGNVVSLCYILQSLVMTSLNPPANCLFGNSPHITSVVYFSLLCTVLYHPLSSCLSAVTQTQ